MYTVESWNTADTYDGIGFYCPPTPSGSCLQRFDVPGEYFISSGDIGKSSIMLNAKITVGQPQESMGDVKVLVKGLLMHVLS